MEYALGLPLPRDFARFSVITASAHNSFTDPMIYATAVLA